MTRPTFQKKYYSAVKETLYQTSLENGLTVTLLPKKDFNEVLLTQGLQQMIRVYNNIHKGSLIS